MTEEGDFVFLSIRVRLCCSHCDCVAIDQNIRARVVNQFICAPSVVRDAFRGFPYTVLGTPTPTTTSFAIAFTADNASGSISGQAAPSNFYPINLIVQDWTLPGFNAGQTSAGHSGEGILPRRWSEENQDRCTDHLRHQR